jgi:hypothetical protein
MDAAGPLEEIWAWIQAHLPGPIAALPPWVQIAIGLGIVLIGGLVMLTVLAVIVRVLFRGKKTKPEAPSLEEDLATYPPAPTSGGDRRLLVEGVPVRVRLVVVAPAGKQAEFNEEQLDETLDHVLPGLGQIRKYDKPRVRVWPTQISYEGFAKHFHRNTLVPQTEGGLTPWVVVAGRAKLGKTQLMLGLALQALKPTTVGRLTLEAHEWESKLRVRVREG